MCVSPYIAKTSAGDPIPVPCGKCLDCRKQYQNEWIFRLRQEAKRTLFPCFITLTYNDEHLPMECDVETGEMLSVVRKRDFQLFMKRLRKNGGDFLHGCRYYAIGEYGSKFNRAHMHAILIAPAIDCVDRMRKLVEKSWCDRDGNSLGFSSTKFANDNSYHYVCKYMNKLDKRFHLAPPFRLFSRSIGLNFLTDRIVDYYLTTFDRTCINGRARIGLPRYYKRKLDILSQGRESFKRSGLCYSDLLEDVTPVEGTKYFYLKDFTTHYWDYYNAACAYVIHSVDGVEFVECISTPTRQQVWQHYVNTHKAVKDMILEDARLLSECQIRNKLIGRVSVSYNVTAKILQE